eukprot:5668691-Prymnesium_polylepis.1
MDDPDFWTKVLGEEAAQPEEEVDDADEWGRRRSRRSVGEPQRLAPSWEPPPLASSSKEPKDKSKDDNSWSRAQLQALYSG